MKDGRAGRAREGEKLGIAGAAGVGRALFGDVVAHRRLIHDPTQKLYSGDDGIAVELARQIARLYRRRLARIGRLDAHEAAALRPQLTDRCDEARERMRSEERRVGKEGGCRGWTEWCGQSG